MGAGAYRDRLRLEQPSTGTDGAGQPLDAWDPVIAEIYGDVRYQRGTEAIRAGAVASKAQVSIRLRGAVEATSAMRLVHLVDGRVFDVQSVHPDARRRHVDLVCKVTT